MEILKFSTPACVYCKIAHPSVIAYAKEQGATVIEVNADSDTNTAEEKALVAKYSIQSVPVMVVRPSEETNMPESVLYGFQDIMGYISYD